MKRDMFQYKWNTFTFSMLSQISNVMISICYVKIYYIEAEFQFII